MPTKFSSSLRTLVFAFGLVALPKPALAEQFTLMDVEFTFTKEDADNSSPSQSHYYVRSDMLGQQPGDWTSPVDYRNGSVHVRTEVIDKPAGSEVTQWTLCYIPNVGIGQGYGCTGSGTYTEEGLYERDESMTSWWENTSLDWTKGIDEMHLVIKDSDGGSGHAHKREDFEKFFPTTMRITMVQVAAGSTYDESLVPELQSNGSGGSPGAGGNSAAGGGSATGGESSGGGSASGGAEGSGGGSGGEAESEVPGTGGSFEPEAMPNGAAPVDTSGCTIVAHHARTPSQDLSLLLALASLILFVGARRICMSGREQIQERRR